MITNISLGKAYWCKYWIQTGRMVKCLIESNKSGVSSDNVQPFLVSLLNISIKIIMNNQNTITLGAEELGGELNHPPLPDMVKFRGLLNYINYK